MWMHKLTVPLPDGREVVINLELVHLGMSGDGMLFVSAKVVATSPPPAIPLERGQE